MVDRIPFPRHEFGRLLVKALTKKNMKRADVVKAMGYTDIDKGLRVFDRHITSMSFKKNFLQELPSILGIDRQVFKNSLTATYREAGRKKEEIRRQSFKPHLWVETEKHAPSQVTIAIFSGAANRKVIPIPEEIAFLPEEEQIKEVGCLARKHYNEENRILKMFFGEITGYFYQAESEKGFRMSVTGDLIREKSRKWNQGPILSIGKKKYSGEQIKEIF